MKSSSIGVVDYGSGNLRSVCKALESSGASATLVSEATGLAGFDRTTASLLNLALLFVPLVTLSLGGLGIAGEAQAAADKASVAALRWACGTHGLLQAGG